MRPDADQQASTAAGRDPRRLRLGSPRHGASGEPAQHFRRPSSTIRSGTPPGIGSDRSVCWAAAACRARCPYRDPEREAGQSPASDLMPPSSPRTALDAIGSFWPAAHPEQRLPGRLPNPPKPGSAARNKDARRSSEGPTSPPTSATPGAPPVSCPLPWSFSVRIRSLRDQAGSATFATGCKASRTPAARPHDPHSGEPSHRRSTSRVSAPGTTGLPCPSCGDRRGGGGRSPQPAFGGCADEQTEAVRRAF